MRNKMYENRPKSCKEVRQLISLLYSSGFPLQYKDYIGLDAVCEFSKLPWREIVDAVLSEELASTRMGTIGMGDDDDGDGFPFTRWQWVDEWLEKRTDFPPKPVVDPVPAGQQHPRNPTPRPESPPSPTPSK